MKDLRRTLGPLLEEETSRRPIERGRRRVAYRSATRTIRGVVARTLQIFDLERAQFTRRITPAGKIWTRALLAMLFLGIGTAAVTAGPGLVALMTASRLAQLQGGVVLKDHVAAPDFRLTDQFGKTDTLSSLLGRPVLLTFLYTRCTDVCPLLATNLHQTYKKLASEAPQVEIVALTVDPEHDTPDNIRQFLDERGLTHEWRFLTGSRNKLAPVWSAYHIVAQPETPIARPVSRAAQGEARGLPTPPEVIEHSAPIFLIDRHGALRAMLPVDETPETLTWDMRVLLSES
jgi:protein SCO1